MISSIKTQYKNMASYYNLDFADFLKQYMNMDEETFNSKATQAAKDQVKANLAADLIIEKAKIDVSDKTLEKTARLDIVEDWVADNCKQVKSTSSDSSKSGSNSTGSTGSTENTK